MKPSEPDSNRPLAHQLYTLSDQGMRSAANPGQPGGAANHACIKVPIFNSRPGDMDGAPLPRYASMQMVPPAPVPMQPPMQAARLIPRRTRALARLCPEGQS